MSAAVDIIEVGPRDGLQNEAGVIPVDDKLRLIQACHDAGLHHIEVGAFVSPKWVPQMASTPEVLDGLDTRGVQTVLVPNARGMQAVLDHPKRDVIHEFAVFVSASEGFSKANLNCTIAESLGRLDPVVRQARDAGFRVRGYVSCVTDCPFDGAVAPDAVAHVSDALLKLGCDTLSLGDTIGRGTPERIGNMLDAVLGIWDAARVAGHYHDTGGLALDNVGVSLDKGLRAFDSSVGGLGGCPYAPGAPGNLATEALVPYLQAQGFETNVDLPKLQVAAEMASHMRGAYGPD